MTERLEDCNGGHATTGRHCDCLGWWEQPPSISDELWVMLALASPDLKPGLSGRAKDGRTQSGAGPAGFPPQHYPEPSHPSHNC